jgi:hypothetical protein
LLPTVGQSAEEVVLAPLSLRQQPPRRRVSNSLGVVIPSITKLLVFGKKALTNCRLRPEDRLRFLARENPTSEFCGDIGWPIATGVIEGACRHLVKDRMDITGARWGLESAEAILKLRALITNNDFDTYWHFHLTQEQRRVHAPR